jgi:hypothetical protein
MLDLQQLIAKHRSDAATKQELISRELIESTPVVIKEASAVSYDRNEMLWRPADPQVEKAMAYASRTDRLLHGDHQGYRRAD